MKRALDSNIDLVVGRLNPQIQDLANAQTRGFYRPTLTSSFGDNFSRSQPTSQLSGGTSLSAGIESGTYNWSAGISQALQFSGGTASVTWANSRNDTTSNNAILNPTYTSSVQLSVTQPLIKNFRIDSNRQALATGLIALENANTTVRALVINTVANTKDAYWDFVYAVQAVDAARMSVDLAQKLVEDNKVRVEIGTLAPLDVVTAQAEAATRQQTLVSTVANRRTAEMALKRLIVSGTADPIWNATLNPTDRPADRFRREGRPRGRASLRAREADRPGRRPQEPREQQHLAEVPAQPDPPAGGPVGLLRGLRHRRHVPREEPVARRRDHRHDPGRVQRRAVDHAPVQLSALERGGQPDLPDRHERGGRQPGPGPGAVPAVARAAEVARTLGGHRPDRRRP